MKDSSGASLTALMGRLKALYWFHWTAHWQTAGDPFYGDHLMFERMRDTTEEELDGLAEKIVGYLGSDGVDPTEILSHESETMAPDGNQFDLAERALGMERGFQAALAFTYEKLDDAGDLSLGLDDFLQAMASQHDTHIYLLQQRLIRPSKEAYAEGDNGQWDEWEEAGLLEDQ